MSDKSINETIDVSKFFSLSKDLLCIAGKNGYFVKVNPSFLKTLGWKEKTILSKPFLYFVHEDDIESTKKAFYSLLKGEPTISFENRYKSKSGKYIWLSWTSTPTGDGLFYSIARDISYIKNREDELQRFKVATENAFDQVVITDSEGIIIYANKALEKITGYKVEEALGRKAGKLWGGLMTKDFYSNFWYVIKKQKRAFVGELQNRKKNGLIYTAEVRVTPVFDDNGNSIYFIGIERDVTEIKAMANLNQIMIDREVKMVDLKKKIKLLQDEVLNLRRKQVVPNS